MKKSSKGKSSIAFKWNMQEIIDRIKKVSMLKTDSEIAKVLGLSNQAFSNAKLRNNPPLKRLYAYCKENEVSLGYILTGDGQVNSDYSNANDVIKRITHLLIYNMPDMQNPVLKMLEEVNKQK